MDENRKYYYNNKEISKEQMVFELSLKKKWLKDDIEKYKLPETIKDDLLKNMFRYFDIVVHMLAPAIKYGSIIPYEERNKH